jgi:hypothetical protein
MLRRMLGLAVGLVATVGIVLLAMYVADRAWPEKLVRVRGSAGWYLWAAIGAGVHFGGGFAGGRLWRALSSQGRLRDRLFLFVAVLAFGLWQLAGDWGHPFRFWWLLGLAVATSFGILVGSAQRRPADRDIGAARISTR